MNYFTLALKSIRRNARANLAYFLSNVVFVLIFALSDLFVYHPWFYRYQLDGKTFMVYFLIYQFLFVVFLFSSVGFFLQTRKKEIALYLIHGATIWQVGLVIFLENIMIGFVATLAGIAVSLSVFKLFLILIAPILGVSVFPFYLSLEVLWDIVKTFVIIYLLHSVFILAFIQFRKVTTLLKGKRLSTMKKKYSIFLFFVGVILLSGPYLAEQYYSESINLIILFYILTVVACYLILAHFGIFYAWMTKRKNQQHPIKLMWNTQQFFQPFSVPLLGVIGAFFLCISISSITSLIVNYQTTVQSIEDYSFTFYIYANEKDKSKLPGFDSLVQRELKKSSIAFQKHSFDAVILREKGGSYIRAVRYSDYQAIVTILGWKKPKALKDGEIIYLAAQNGFWVKQKNHKSINTLHLIGTKNTFHLRGIEKNIFPGFDAIVVSDSTYTQLSKIKTTNNFSPYRQLPSEKYAAFYVPIWMKSEPEKMDKQEEIYTKLEEKILSTGYGISIRPYFGLGANGVASLLQSIVCFFAGVSFLYFCSYTRLEEDQEQFQVLSKLGWSEKELRQLGTKQMSFLFFVPFGLAALENIIIDHTILSTVFYAVGIQLVGLVVCFLLARFSYLGKVIPKKSLL